jgi:TusA-related sulfurtransferase
MSDEISVAKVMDLKGLACPMPVVKISKGIKEVEVGEVAARWFRQSPVTRAP